MEWREGEASSLDYQVAELRKYLVEAENAEAIAETQGDLKLAAELRAVSSAVRARINVMEREAGKLRAAPERPAQMSFYHQRKATA